MRKKEKKTLNNFIIFKALKYISKTKFFELKSAFMRLHLKLSKGKKTAQKNDQMFPTTN